MRGLWSVSIRSLRVLSALGWRGLLRRVQAASLAAPPRDAHSGESLPQPAALDAINLRVCVVLHIHYPDLIDEIRGFLANIPVPFSLLVSVTDASACEHASQAFSSLAQVGKLDIRAVENRGRDIAPMLVEFSSPILEQDVVCHIHTKKSLRTGAAQDDWRGYLLTSLLGSAQRVEWILGMLQAMPTLGLVYPESHHDIPLAGHAWLGNLEPAKMLGERLGIPVEANEYLDFPAGSMFWATVEAIRPLLELGLESTDFPEESGQADGTLQHAVERMLGKVAAYRGYRHGVLPASGEPALLPRGTRNWHRALFPTAREWIQARSLEADIVSFDIFDTLVTRGFLTPEGARQYLAHVVEREFSIGGFGQIRSVAEKRARERAVVGDPGLEEIYAVLPELLPGNAPPPSKLMALELAIEARQLRPRHAMVSVMRDLIDKGKRVVAVSDMYLGQRHLEQVIPSGVLRGLQGIHVSCETGLRKDTGEAWCAMPVSMGVDAARWLHVGDNEHSDVLLPQRMGFLPPVHVLRPAVLLEAVPALRELARPAGGSTNWSEQLTLGLLANRFADIADRTPEAFSATIRLSDPCTVGYTVFGPLVLDYLAWLARGSLARDARKILFLSREGYLLEQAFQLLKAAAPELAGVQGHYFLASRRSAGVAALQDWNDLDRLLQGTFNGTLGQLVRARLGQPMASALESALGATAMQSPVFLPEMRDEIKERLRPAFRAIRDIAAGERKTYLRYWQGVVGNATVMLSDVGYAGTIQTHLAHLLEQPLHGAYFALDERASQLSAHGGSAEGRYFDARTTDVGGACPVLDHSLVLEAVLTAPTGQFSHFIEHSDGHLVPQYSDGAKSPHAALERMHAGTLDFIRDAIAVLGPDVLHVNLTRAMAQQPLVQLATGHWVMADASNALSTEDHFSGRGRVRYSVATRTASHH